MSTTTKNYQIIQLTGEEEYVVLHPETNGKNVIVEAEGVKAKDVDSAFKELNDNIKSITGGGVVTGVKGSNEEEYRIGQVEITKENIGLGSVDNTSDKEKPISDLTQAALDLKVGQDEIDAAVKGLAQQSYVDSKLEEKANTSDLGSLAYEDSLDANAVGLGNVTNDAQVKRSEMGEANGVATLDGTGRVPAAQLPSYVDDVETYENRTSFPEEGEDGKIYIDKETNKQYRWDGESDYVEIPSSLALGESASTAYAGNKGKANAEAITALQTRAETIESKNAEQDSAIEKAQGDATAAKTVADAAMPKEGGTFTGAVTLVGEPTDDLHASTKKYVDDTVSTIRETAEGAQGTATENATEISNIKDGTTKVAKATEADSATTATSADSANSATRLATAQEFSISGDITAEAKTFDGSAAVELTASLSDTGVVAGSYSAVTVDKKGRVTAGAQYVEVGKPGQATPSETLAIGGLFFKELT